MAKTEFIRARVDEDLKVNIEKLFDNLGITMTEAITLFLKQCELNQGIPFEIKVPNAVTEKAIEDSRKGIGLNKFDNINDMFKELDEE